MGESEERERGAESTVRSVGLTRRQLVEGAAGVCALAILGGGSVAFAGEGELMRPPGAQDSSLLIGACIRCDRCRSACPRGVIDVATIEDGLINVRTPKMNFVLGYCDECAGEYRCIKACPTSALASFDKHTDKIGIAVVDTDRCVAYGVSALCKYECITVCPEHALSKDDEGRLLLDEQACWGCGMCQYACLSNAYGSYDGSARRGVNIEMYRGDARV